MKAFVLKLVKTLPYLKKNTMVSVIADSRAVI